MVWYSHLFQNFPQFIVIHTVKGFGIVNKAEIDVFLELRMIQTFSSPVATAEFSKFAGILSTARSQHHLSGFEIAQLEFYYLH